MTIELLEDSLSTIDLAAMTGVTFRRIDHHARHGAFDRYMVGDRTVGSGGRRRFQTRTASALLVVEALGAATAVDGIYPPVGGAAALTVPQIGLLLGLLERYELHDYPTGKSVWVWQPGRLRRHDEPEIGASARYPRIEFLVTSIDWTDNG